MTDCTDLTTRLRAVDVDSDHDCYLNAPLFGQAAAIEALQAEVARLREQPREGVMVTRKPPLD